MIKLQDDSMIETEYPVGVHMDFNKGQIVKLINLFLTIKEFREKHVCILCQGSSGVIIATMFSMLIPNPNRIVHVKKDGELSHTSNGDYIAGIGDEINIIVDDFIGSGSTVNRIYNIKFRNGGKIGGKVDAVCVTGADKAYHLNFETNYFLSNGR